jgi:hypothetical protein
MVPGAVSVAEVPVGALVVTGRVIALLLPAAATGRVFAHLLPSQDVPDVQLVVTVAVASNIELLYR